MHPQANLKTPGTDHIDSTIHLGHDEIKELKKASAKHSLEMEDLDRRTASLKPKEPSKSELLAKVRELERERKQQGGSSF
ncbi:hypothetical protein PG994_004460 [Apiospora phragmitis]|uniref:Uncharacterized protein n=1 Tax=Apiospora phragmitis TaxID=2905665 RepID=A0ABR1VQN9_9PEZI